MVPNPLGRLSTWRQVAIIAVVVPVAMGLVLAAFAWPAARTSPRDLPVGLVAPSASAADATSTALGTAGFQVHRYADRADATSAIEHRTVYGALLVTARGTTVLTASAAAPTVATLLATVGTKVA